MRVYKIEPRKAHKGVEARFRYAIYHEGYLPDDVIDEHRNSDHPTPYEDTGLHEWATFLEDDRDAYQCAFASPEQLFAWFIDSLDVLNKRGAVMAVYEVDAKYVLIGYRQCMFDRRKAKLISRKRYIPLDHS